MSSPGPRKGPQIAGPAPPPGHQHARYQESWHSKIIYAGQDRLTVLFAESGLSWSDSLINGDVTGTGPSERLPASRRSVPAVAGRFRVRAAVSVRWRLSCLLVAGEVMSDLPAAGRSPLPVAAPEGLK